jgi:hypothetical protein
MPSQREATAKKMEQSVPWLTPGSAKEEWKSHGNHYDYREFKATRPSDLRIEISGPRLFREL